MARVLLSVVTCLLWSLLPALIATAQTDTELRTWTDASGEKSVVAKLIWTDNQSALLRREDGVEIPVAIESLSAKDRGYVESRAAKGDPETHLRSHFVDVVWKVDEQRRSTVGLVVHKIDETGYVAVYGTLAGWKEGDPIAITSPADDRERRAIVKNVSRSQRKLVMLLAADADKLPEPVRFDTTTPIGAGMTAVVHSFAGDTTALSMIKRDVMVKSQTRQPPCDFLVTGRQLKFPTIGLVTSSAGEPIALVIGGYARGRPRSPMSPETMSVHAPTRGSLFGSRIEEQFLALVGANRETIKYEIVVCINDPLNSLRDVTLTIWEDGLAARRAKLLLKRPTPVDDTLKRQLEETLANSTLLKMQRQPPSDVALMQLQPNTTAPTWTGRFRVDHNGDLPRTAILAKVTAVDHDGQEHELGEMNVAHSAQQAAVLLANKNQRLPQIYNHSGLPLLGLPPMPHPDGGWLLTGDYSRATSTKPEDRPAPPQPEEVGESLVDDERTEQLQQGKVLKFPDILSDNGLVFSADSKRLFCLDRTNTLRLIDVETGRELRRLAAVEKPYSMSLSQAGLVLSFRGQGVVRVVDPLTLKVVREIPVPVPLQVAGTTTSSLGFIVSQLESFGRQAVPALCMVNFETGRVLHVIYRPRQRLSDLAMRFDAGEVGVQSQPFGKHAIDFSCRSMKFTSNGKRLVLTGYSTQIFRVEDTDLIFDSLQEKAKSVDPRLQTVMRQLSSLSGFRFYARKIVLAPTGNRHAAVYGKEILFFEAKKEEGQ